MPGPSRLLTALAAALGAAAVLASATGCSGSADAASAAPTPAATPTVADSIDLHLPVADYLLTPQAQLKLDRAAQKLVDQCMHRYGLALADEPVAARSGPTTLTQMRYGATSAQQAKTTGYHFGPANPGYLATPSASPAPENTDPGYKLVLQGNGTPGKNDGTPAPYGSRTVQPGGCMGEMTKQLAGRATFLGDAALVHEIDAKSFTESQQTPAVKEAFRAWSACMQAKGFHYGTPMDAVNDPAFAGESPGRDEQRTAEADVACKQQGNVVGIWFAAEVDRQHALMAEHKDELRTIGIQMQEQAAQVDDTLNTAG
ncbi:hypothetical protein [Kitasatospora sp. DSM 101779]|uniref:hypothetical protein n=1 Tax=Kitasatospora sp. DSM 101779 TaxID=2853165 RepID=UPI0021D8A4F8|nr:hypothetical protein [Kitasatospora sp. DSM 101779]MCU7822104.1 hypothetical protein [Kitasatospora sp. DSM 101779]